MVTKISRRVKTYKQHSKHSGEHKIEHSELKQQGKQNIQTAYLGGIENIAKRVWAAKIQRQGNIVFENMVPVR